MRTLTTVLAAGLVSCCTSSPRPMQDVDPSPRNADRGGDGNATPTDVKERPVPSAQFTFVSRRREHPPISKIRFDASLRNPGDRPRWFLLPADAGAGTGAMATFAFGVTVWTLPGTGNVSVARFTAADSFYAIQLPPDAEVELRSLELLMAGEPPSNPMALEVIVADSFTVGGEPPLVWTKTPTTSEPRADATMEGARRVLEETMPQQRSLPVALQGEARLGVSLALEP